MIVFFFPGREGLLLCWYFKTAVSEKEWKKCGRGKSSRKKKKTQYWRNKEGKEKWDYKTEKKECDNYWEKCTTVKQFHRTDSLAPNQWMDWMNCLRQQFWKSPTLSLVCTELAERYIQGRRVLHQVRSVTVLIWPQFRWRPESVRHGNWESGKLFSQGWYLVSCWRMQ